MAGSGGAEKAAAEVLCRAVELDREMRLNEAVQFYEQGIRLLLQASKGINVGLRSNKGSLLRFAKAMQCLNILGHGY